MSFLNQSTSFSRFRISEPVPSSLWAELGEKLRQYACIDIDETPEERSFGWTAFGDILDTAFHKNPFELGEYVLFSLRLDTRRIPPAVIKKYLSLASQKEEQPLKESGRTYISRERKKELKEHVLLKLRIRFLPTPAEFQVIWNTGKNIIYFSSTQAKILDLFQELFTRSFNLHLELLTPYELALAHLGDPAQLDTFEPATFT